MKSVHIAVFVLATGGAALACSATGDADETRGRGHGGATATPTSNGGSLAVGSGGANATGGGSIDIGTSTGIDFSPCDPAGATRPCCQDAGTQTCGGGELSTWGPCLSIGGVVLDACETVASPPETIAPPPPPPPPPDPPPPGVCGPGMVCKPGAIRYCDVTGFEYTIATCLPDGNWGPCDPTVAPPGWCDPTGFSPELCCPPLHLCCQNDPGGPFMDWGSGACGEISCP